MISHNENVKFDHVERHDKWHNSKYSTHIILQCIQDLKEEVYA